MNEILHYGHFSLKKWVSKMPDRMRANVGLEMRRCTRAVFRVAGYSNIGLRKKTNQDSCLAEVATTPYGDIALVCVCDGVGGLSSGELASCSAIRWLIEWFETRCSILLAQYADLNVEALLDAIQIDWESGLLALNDELRRYGRSGGGSLGTTFTALLLYRGRYLIGHIGDTRVYRFYGGEMALLTDDQTWVAQELARGNITLAQARSHPKKNVILQSVGTQSDLSPVFSRGDDAVNTTYMVCCDGYRNELFDDEINSAFGGLEHAGEREMYDRLETLANLVMQRSELDNISAVVLAHQAGETYIDHELSDAMSTLREVEVKSHDERLYDDEPAEATTYLDDDAPVMPSEGSEGDQTTLLDDESYITQVLGTDLPTKAGEQNG